MEKKKFLFKYLWRGTAKLVWITASNEDEAMIKAAKSKEGEGALEWRLIREG